MLLTKKSNKIYLLLLFAISLCYSCDALQEHDEYKSIANGKWDKNNSIDFNFTVKDTIHKKNLFINLRNNNDYSFSNLFLITTMSFPDNQIITDTLEYDMTDVNGQFLGEGVTEIKENKLLYKEHIKFPKKGNYIFSVRQAMRKNNNIEGIASLEGITDIGFRIEKIK